MEPNISLVVGIKTEKATRSFVPDEDAMYPRLEYFPYPESCKYTLEAGYVDDLYYGKGSEFSPERPGPIVGLVIDAVPYGSSIGRALMNVLRKNSLTQELNLWQGDRPCIFDGMIDASRIVPENRNVEYFGGNMVIDTDVNWEFALHVLKYAGWDKVTRQDLRAYLIMDWE